MKRGSSGRGEYGTRMEQTLYTIGHSNHELAQFLELLRRHEVAAVADVRSSPYSAYNPQYNRETLREFLEERGVAYLFLGEQLGARRKEHECYDDEGRVHFDRVAQTPAFREGLVLLHRGMRERRMALMCAEKDPLTCHRTILICRYLGDAFGDVRHILEDGSIESHAQAESRLLALCRLPERDLFHGRDELVAQAYEQQELRVAYVADGSDDRRGSDGVME